MTPTMGIRPISIHQPLLFVSCNRLTPTAIEGRSRAKEMSIGRLEKADISSNEQKAESVILHKKPVPLIILAAAPTTLLNRKKDQYSLRPARPLKSTYFLLMHCQKYSHKLFVVAPLGVPCA